MITGKVSSAPKYAYFNVDGKGFNSGFGGLTFDGNALSVIGGKFSNLGVQP